MSVRSSVRVSRTVRDVTYAKTSSSYCLRCEPQIYHICRRQPQYPSLQWRPFSSTIPSLKKKDKGHAKADLAPPSSKPGIGEKEAATEGAFDFSGLQSKILKATEHLAHQLSQLRAGGRFNPEQLEELKVQLKVTGEGGKGPTTKVKDLAQVVVKGRNVSVICHEEDHVKPVNSAIVTSKLNLTPHGPNPEALTTLTIQIPPPTGESRQEALMQASKAAEEALGRIREARGGHQKKLKSLQTSKKVRPDDFHKAQSEMETVVKNGNDEVKKILDNSKRVLEG
ncbi:ribosome recycling factor [Tothia fuscella]|uniref:Ribosome recycling factor n=1 Tax=Tothia fuscella TaxID=1048955 RepID=A0A9P4NG44_9PEZI|nr:ribosome recycling factor [Tothia fuscella]